MTRDSKPNILEFLEDYEKLKPEDQNYMPRLLAAVAARIRSDPEAEQIAGVDLFREVIQDIAPERLDQFTRQMDKATRAP